MTSITADGDTKYIQIYQLNNDIIYNIINKSDGSIVSSGTINFNQSGGCNIINNTPNPTSNLIINFTSNITFRYTTQYFIIGSQYILIDGLNNTITITGYNYLGLVQNDTYGNITIQNIKVDGTNSNLEEGGGWIGQSYFKYGNFTNCSSNGPIGNYSSKNNCGGIVGSSAGSGGIITATNCYSTGPISVNSGGIFGSSAGFTNGTATTTNCYSTGPIDNYSGGIFGSNAGINGNATATNCYSTGDIDNGSGGIFGPSAGYNSGTATATNCYSIGAIDVDSGGIFGFYAGVDSDNVTASYCTYNGTFDLTDTSRYGNLAALGSQNITITSANNIIGYENYPNNIFGVSGDIITIGYDTNLYYIQNNNRTDITDLINPINIINNTKTNFGAMTIKFVTDIPINNSNLYFNLATDWINIDGQNHTFNINNIIGYVGLIQFFSGTHININNIHVDGTNSNLLTNGGWIGQSYFKYGNFTNCSSNGLIGNSTNYGCGGIVGSSAGDGGNVTATNCYSTGPISNQSGGIFGINAGESGDATATNCYSTGAISGESGGIFSSSAGFTNGTATATNCYSTGAISGGSGGIFGHNAGSNSGNASATATNCYSTGAITGSSGGIFGYNAGISGTATATNCYSTGAIIVSGGIFGYQAGVDSGTAIATSCMYNGTFDPTNTSTYGQLAGSNSQNITPTNIVGFINKI